MGPNPPTGSEGRSVIQFVRSIAVRVVCVLPCPGDWRSPVQESGYDDGNMQRGMDGWMDGWMDAGNPSPGALIFI